MDRTVPSSGNEEIQLYMRTYYSLLRSTSPVPIKVLIQAHKSMRSALHVRAHEPTPDLAAFNYVTLRLPEVIDQVQLVVMGQSERIFRKHGYANLASWQQVTAPGRRRRTFFNGDDTLAVFIASRSDIDDLVPMLVAYEIERRKLYMLLGNPTGIRFLQNLVTQGVQDPQACCQRLADLTGATPEEWMRLYRVWQDKLPARLLRMAGIDTRYDPQQSEADLALHAVADNRIRLSRNRDLLRRKIITWAHLVRAEQPEEQLLEVIMLFGLQEMIRPFSRCLECNTMLEPVRKSAVLHRLEPLTRKYYHIFRRCPDCDRIYWQGSHQQHMGETMEQVLSTMHKE